MTKSYDNKVLYEYIQFLAMREEDLEPLLDSQQLTFLKRYNQNCKEVRLDSLVLHSYLDKAPLLISKDLVMALKQKVELYERLRATQFQHIQCASKVTLA